MRVGCNRPEPTGNIQSRNQKQTQASSDELYQHASVRVTVELIDWPAEARTAFRYIAINIFNQ